jgi:hypothetical protein
LASQQEPPEKDGDTDGNGGEQSGPRPGKFFRHRPFRVHCAVPGAPGILTALRAPDIFAAMKFSRKKMVDVVIFMGLLVNLVVITLIIYYYVI